MKNPVWYVGIDPGSEGAIAFYDLANDCLGPIWDMPVVLIKIAGSKRKRIDAPLLNTYMRSLVEHKVVKVTLELVQGYGGQGAAAAFSFGFSAGQTYMAVVANGLPLDHVRPQDWKRSVRCGTDKSHILQRARELFPGRDDWHGPRGGIRDGRAEAAMLAYYGAKMSVRG